jgi:hypothetical protein
MVALKTSCATDFTRQLMENIVCKVYQKHTKNKSDGLFFDILIPNQNIYSVRGNDVRAMSSDGKSNQKMKGSLLPLVPFCGLSAQRNYILTHQRIGLLVGNRQQTPLGRMFWMEL